MSPSLRRPNAWRSDKTREGQYQTRPDSQCPDRCLGDSYVVSGKLKKRVHLPDDERHPRLALPQPASGSTSVGSGEAVRFKE
jgi:hypothetical protein